MLPSRPSNQLQGMFPEDSDAPNGHQLHGMRDAPNLDGSDSSFKSATPELLGHWGVNWASPATMTGLFLSATGFAIGHHLYYSQLNGTVVVNTSSSQWSLEAVQNSQEWKIRFGTGFAFLVKTMFSAAVTVAFQQSLWLTARKKAITIAGLDAMFSAADSLLSFGNVEFLSKAKTGAALAFLIWAIPLSALISPATLTVTPSTISNSSMMPVPSLNFSDIAPLFDYDSSVIGSDGASTDNGITPYLSRLVSSAASTMQILPMSKAIANSTYQMRFNGPSLRCHPTSPLVEKAIMMTLNATWFASTHQSMLNDFSTTMAWLAFPPTSLMMASIVRAGSADRLSSNWLDFLNFAASCIFQPVSTLPLPKIPNPMICEGIAMSNGNRSLHNVSTMFLDDTFNYGRFWVWAQNSTYDCILTDTEYNVGFSYSISENVQRIIPDYDFKWTENDLHGSYFPITSAIVNFLGGAIRGFNSGIMTSKTRVSETAIFGALKVDPNSLAGATNSGLDSAVLPPDIQALARGKSVGELIEELSRNVTLSLFSANNILSLNTTVVNVNSTINVNIYSYNKQNLILTYSVTFGLALIGVFAGVVAYLRNGVSHGNSFSAFMLTTRNHRLDQLSKGHSMGSKPLGDSIKTTKLRFGLLHDEDAHEQQVGVLRRVGFGLDTQITPLRKGESYY